MPLKNPANYHGNLKGVGLYCLDALKWWKKYTPQDEADDMLRTGRMYAYTEVLQVITGRRYGSTPDNNQFIESAIKGIPS